MRFPTGLSIGLAAALGGLACVGSGEGPASPSGIQPPRPQYAVTGTVFDSALGTPVAGVRLQVSGTQTTTDGQGRYTALADSGVVDFVSWDRAYEPLNLRRLVDRPGRVDVNLRRLAPLIARFRVEGNSVLARVLDLQGRKTINRWTGTRVVLQGDGFETSLLANRWIWRAVDHLAWDVTIDAGRPDVDHVLWEVRDSEGGEFSVTCEAPSRCDGLPSIEPMN